jgi:hypothetical protein
MVPAAMLARIALVTELSAGVFASVTISAKPCSIA